MLPLPTLYRSLPRRLPAPARRRRDPLPSRQREAPIDTDARRNSLGRLV